MQNKPPNATPGSTPGITVEVDGRTYDYDQIANAIRMAQKLGEMVTRARPRAGQADADHRQELLDKVGAVRVLAMGTLDPVAVGKAELDRFTLKKSPPMLPFEFKRPADTEGGSCD